MIFRKTALERLSSPEQLDQLMQVTSPKGWLALGGIGLLVVSALVWGFLGSVPTLALGEGILIRQGGVSDVAATRGGQIDQNLVEVGESVHTGQVLATIRQPGLLRQIEDTRERLRTLQAEYDGLLRFAETQRRLSGRSLEQQRDKLEQSLASLEREQTLLAERLVDERLLLADGLITRQSLLVTEQELNAKRDQIEGIRLEVDGLELERLETEHQLKQQIETRGAALRDLELQQREYQASLEESVSIVSPYDGRILELLVDRGDLVNPGTPVLTVEIVSEELLAVLFVPAAAGKQVRPEMTVQVSPGTVKREEHGYMLGEVTWVAEFPSTSRGMNRLLANEQLVARLMLEGPPVQVNVALRRDPSTPTGFLWSSSGGPDLEITSGTLMSGSVIVRENRPIDLVIPKVREKVGI